MSFAFKLLALLVAAGAAHAQIIFDTDSGEFGDDGVALTMLLRSPKRKEVRGITVVSGNVWARDGAAYMERNARLLGLPKLPVLVGAEAPLVHTVRMSEDEKPLEFAGAFATPLSNKPVKRGAIDLLIRAIEANPGKATILAIGPLTNIAMLLRLRPDLETKIGSIVIMGGTIDAPGNTNRTAEFNFWFDPEAASVVLRSAIPHKMLVALDVCNKVPVTREMFDQIVAVKTPITELYKEDYGNRYPGFLKNPNTQGWMWDALATAIVIDPSLIKKSEPMRLDVEKAFGPRYGSVTRSKESPPTDVIVDVDLARIREMYRGALTARSY